MNNAFLNKHAAHLPQEFNDFLVKHMLGARKLSPHSCLAYEGDLLQFCDYIYYGIMRRVPQDGLPPTDPDYKSLVIERMLSFKASGVDQYLAALRGLKYSAATIVRKLSSLTSLLSYLVSIDLIGPLNLPKYERVKRRIPVALSDDDVDRLLLQPDPDTFSGARDLAIMSLFIYAGLRLGEAVRLTIGDFDADARKLCIATRSSRAGRIIELTSVCVNNLGHYVARLTANGDYSGKSKILFVNLGWKPIKVRSIHRSIFGYGKKCGLVAKPTILRHTFARRLLAASGNMQGVADQMGFISKSSAKVYEKFQKAKDSGVESVKQNQHV